MLKEVLLGVLTGAVALTIGILLGHFAIDKGSSVPEWVRDASRDVDESIIEKFLAELDTNQLKENLRELTKVPHMATTSGDEATVDFMLKRWQDPNTGLDSAWREDYKVYLSFPNKTSPNKVSVVDPANTVQFTAREREKVYKPDQEDPEVVQPFAAYSPAGNVKGKLVYANQGKMSDYELLNTTLDLRGTIAITRYGGEGRSKKAINAARFGIVGVLVYTEPYDMNDGLVSESETYPHSWYLPPSGVERGSYNIDFGDLLTPYLAAKDDTYRIPKEDITGIPPIPAQPIGFEDAERLICELDGDDAPDEWQGSLNCIYKLGGPGFKATSTFSNSNVHLDIYNTERLEYSANVMGIIRGSVEPDRYVIYGNHRDSWVHGAIDPSSGTAVMLEITRVLGKMVKEGKWRPRRSIIFGSWGAEEFGLIGSAEYTEEYFSKLSERTVAYINVDISVFANATLRASASPAAQSVIFTASKQVNAPGTTTTVYENWKQYSNRTSPNYGIIPNVGFLTGAGSDYAAFMHYLGITSMDISYYYDRSKTRARIYPAYHTAYDTFDYASTYIDPGFTSHQAVARTAGNVLLRLADSLLLPFNCSDYAESLEQYLSQAVTAFEEKLAAKGISMESLKKAVQLFRDTATKLDRVIRDSDLAKETPLKARQINDQLMLLDRAFLDPLAFPEQYGFRHVIWASKSSSVPTFPGLADAVEKAESTGLKEDWDQAHKHISIVTQAIAGAAHTLDDVI
ncbi:aminopeptidase NAALADL1 [Sinocyclocheilus rhinocerous]|uniref:aminopeptidase NAALADL1 n=1 Tax=Sinocyclocheilus rhinocerous TaxID=307959 RepID=UPI0007BA424D|nr:PREDICTED: N-acetylated-alpha-linked acidic dipeptidase-like protein [Sinocyclocheilus rhinocerous]